MVMPIKDHAVDLLKKTDVALPMPPLGKVRGGRERGVADQVIDVEAEPPVNIHHDNKVSLTHYILWGHCLITVRNLGF